MQLYALDEKGQWVEASKAIRAMDYRCVECQGVVRMRAGEFRQPHFYHLERPESCRQAGKGIEHLQTQLYIKKLLPEGETHLEVRFPSINRIADVVWEKKRLVFEIQFSPISAEEVKARNQDYKRQGYEVVWILHDEQYNKPKVSGAEKFLFNKPHYFTNIDHEGEGLIYDQLSQVLRGRRVKSGEILPIDLTSPQGDPLFFKGDSRDLSLKITLESPQSSRFKRFYTSLFKFILESSCQ